MALFKIFKGSKDDLGVTGGTDKAYDGYAYFTPDNGKFYIDVIPPGGNDGDPANPGVNRIPLSADKADKDVLGHAIEQTYVADVDIINGTVGLYGGDGSLIKTIQIPTSLQEKTFTNVIGTANNNANAAFYFGKILPTSYYDTWRIEYRVSSITAGRNDARSYHHVILTGTQGNLISYANFNTIANTSYRSIYYHELYRAKEAGITNGYGHLLGVGLHNAWNPTTAANSRTITVEIDRCINCTFTFFDNVIKYASAPGTGSTNYNAVIELDAYTNGLRETSDDNTISQNRIGYTSSVAAETIYRYQVLLRTKDRKLLPVSSANNVISTTERTYTTTPFDPFSEIYYYNSTTTINANGNVGNDTLYRQILADLRYSFGVNNTATYKLVARQPVYLTATLQNDGTAVLTVPSGNENIGPLVQTLPSEEDGLIYIYLGQAYEDTNPYRLELTMNSHPIYMYKNGQIRQYSQYAGGVHWSNVLDKPSTFTPSSHSHGNITNAGELSTATRAVVTDANKKITVADLTVSSATAESTTATTFVHSVTQDAQGKITVKTRPLPTYNNYSLPLAASGTRGGIQIGYTQSGKNYPVQLSNEKAYVNVPWTDTTYTTTTADVIKTITFTPGSIPTLGTAISADDITAWDAGSTPTLGTAISADDITAWSAGSLPTFGTAFSVPNVTGNSSVTASKVTKTDNTVVKTISQASSTSTTIGSVEDGVLTLISQAITQVGAVTAGSTATASAVSITDVTATKVTLGTAFSIPNVTGAGTLPSLSYTAKSIPNITSVGSIPTLTYTARSIPNVTAVGSVPTLSTTTQNVVTSISAS